MKRTAFLLILALGAAGPAAAASGRLELVQLQGELTSSGRSLSPGDEVPLGAPLRLASGGKAVLRGSEGAVMLKGPAVFTPKPAGFSLTLGGILSVIRPGKRRWTVATPTAVAAVRGTEFFVEVRSESATYVCLCSGALDVTPAGKPKAKPVRMKARHHSAMIFTPGEGMLGKEEGSLQDHSDEELATLRAALGRTP